MAILSEILWRQIMKSQLVMLLIFSIGTVQAGDKKQDELNWAKGVAVDFLAAVRTTDTDQAIALLSTELKKQTDLRNWLLSVANAGLRKDARITVEDISPDQDETSFKGELTGDKHVANFSMRVVKEKDSGKWRISFFRFDEVTERTPKP